MFYNDMKVFLAGVEFPFSNNVSVSPTGVVIDIRVSIPETDKASMEAMPLSRVKFESIPIKVAVSHPEKSLPVFPGDYIVIFDGMLAPSRSAIVYNPEEGTLSMRLQGIPMSISAINMVNYSGLSIGRMFTSLRTAVSAAEERTELQTTGSSKQVAVNDTPIMSLNSILFLEKIVTGSQLRGRMKAPSDLFDFTMNNLLLPLKHAAPDRLSDSDIYTVDSTPAIVSVMGWKEFQAVIKKRYDTDKEETGDSNFKVHFHATHAAFYENVLKDMGTTIDKTYAYSNTKDGTDNLIVKQVESLYDHYKSAGLWGINSNMYYAFKDLKPVNQEQNSYDYDDLISKFSGKLKVVMKGYYHYRSKILDARTNRGKTTNDKSVYYFKSGGEYYPWLALPQVCDFQSQIVKFMFQMLASYNIYNKANNEPINFLSFLHLGFQKGSTGVDFFKEGFEGDINAFALFITGNIFRVMSEVEDLVEASMEAFMINNAKLYSVGTKSMSGFTGSKINEASLGEFKDKVPGGDIVKAFISSGTKTVNKDLSRWLTKYIGNIQGVSNAIVDTVQSTREIVAENFDIQLFVGGFQATGSTDLDFLHSYIQKKNVEYHDIIMRNFKTEGVKEYGIVDILSGKAIYEGAVYNRFATFQAFRPGVLENDSVFPTFRVKNYAAFQQIIQGRVGNSPNELNLQSILGRLYGDFRFSLSAMLNKVQFKQEGKSKNLSNLTSEECPENSISELFLSPMDSYKWAVPMCNLLYRDIARTKSDSYDFSRNSGRIFVRYNHNLGANVDSSQTPAVTYVLDIMRPSSGLIKYVGNKSTVNYAYTEDGKKNYLNKYLYRMDGYKEVTIDSAVTLLYKLMTSNDNGNDPSDNSVLAVNKFDDTSKTQATTASLVKVWNIQRGQDDLLGEFDGAVGSITITSKVKKCDSIAKLEEGLRKNPETDFAGLLKDTGSGIRGPEMRTGDDGGNDIKADLKEAMYAVADNMYTAFTSTAGEESIKFISDMGLFRDFMKNTLGIDPDAYNFYTPMAQYFSITLRHKKNGDLDAKEYYDSKSSVDSEVEVQNKMLEKMIAARTSCFKFFDDLVAASIFDNKEFMDALGEWRDELVGCDIWGSLDDALVNFAVITTESGETDFRMYLSSLNDMQGLNRDNYTQMKASSIDEGNRFIEGVTKSYYKVIYPALVLKAAAMVKDVYREACAAYPENETTSKDEVLNYVADNADVVVKSLGVVLKGSGTLDCTMQISPGAGLEDKYINFLAKVEDTDKFINEFKVPSIVPKDLNIAPTLYRTLTEDLAKDLSMFNDEYTEDGMGFAECIYSGEYYTGLMPTRQTYPQAKKTARSAAIKFLKDELGAELVEDEKPYLQPGRNARDTRSLTYQGYKYKVYLYIPKDTTGTVTPALDFMSLAIDDMASAVMANGSYVKSKKTAFIYASNATGSSAVKDFNRRYLRSSYIPVVVWTDDGAKATVCLLNWESGGKPIPLRNFLDDDKNFPGETDTGFAKGALKKWISDENPFNKKDILPKNLNAHAIMAVIPASVSKGFKDASDSMVKMINDSFVSTFNLAHTDETGSSSIDIRRPVANAAATYCKRIMVNSSTSVDGYPEVSETSAVPGKGVKVAAFDRIFETPSKLICIEGRGGYGAQRGTTIHNGQDIAGTGLMNYKDEAATRFNVIAPCNGYIQYYVQNTSTPKLTGAGFYAMFIPDTSSSKKVAHVLMFAHLRIKQTFEEFKKQENLEITKVLKANKSALYTDPGKIAEDHEYSQYKQLPESDPIVYCSVPKDKMDLKTLRSNIGGLGSSVKIKEGEFIGIIGHSGSCRTGYPNKWGEHLHLGAFPVSVKNKKTDVKTYTGATQLGSPSMKNGLSLQDALKVLAERTANPITVLSRQGYPNISLSDNPEEEMAGNLSSIYGSTSLNLNRFTDANEPTEDLVETVAKNVAYKELLSTMFSVQLGSESLPYYDPYFVDGNFPFAVIYKDDIVITSLASHTVVSTSDGRMLSNLTFTPGISVKGMTALILQMLANPDEREENFERLKGLAMFPPNIVDFFNKTLFSLDRMKQEYATMFGKDNFVFDWREAVVIKTRELGELTLKHLIDRQEIAWDPSVFNTYPPAYSDISVDTSRILGDFKSTGESMMLLDKRRWSSDRLYTYTDSETKAYMPKDRSRSVTKFDPAKAGEYESEATAALNSAGTTSIRQSSQLFYDWKSFMQYLKKYVR